MTPADILTLTPGFAGLGLSLFLLWRQELRQAHLSLRLLAPPDSWKVSIGRRGSPVQATDPAEADYLSMHGIFPVSATNDGTRGGALWNLTVETPGLVAWRLHWFNSGQDLPYALSGRSCEGWSRTGIALACDFEGLSDGLRDLRQAGEVTFRLNYACQGWRGHVRQGSTSLQVSRAVLLEALKSAARFLDLATCQVVPRSRALAAERFAEFSLADHEVDNLTKWALMRDQPEYVVVTDGSPDRLKIVVRRASGVVDQAWSVGAGRTREILGRIAEVQRRFAGDVQDIRDAAVQI